MPLKNWSWNRGNVLAVIASGLLCWALLDVVLYCDTSFRATFGTGRCTLFGLFISTFYDDIHDIITGLWQGAPTTSIAGETTATQWTQCLFVPFIVGWMVYWLWPRLRELPVQGSSKGFIILAIGLVFYVLGFLAENYYIGIMALQLVYAGLIVLFLGWNVMRCLLFPWAFLLFMWPYGFFEDVAFQLRMLMSSLSHHALQLIGVPNLLNGTAILSPPEAQPPFAIDIADPCSGIRSLFALVMVAALAAFFLFRKPWQMLVIILASVPLVLFGNLIRIILLTLGSIHFGEKFALGADDHPSWFHEGAGYAVYFINFTSLMGLGWLLVKLSSDDTTSPIATGPIRTGAVVSSPALRARAAWIVIALAVLTVILCWVIPPAQAGNDTGVVMDLPDNIGDLEGVPQIISQAEHEILPPDTTFARKAYGSFSLPDSDIVNRFVCSIVLSGREKRSIHRPERCLPGQGWSVIDSNIVDVPLQSGHPLKVTALLLTRPITMRDGTSRQLQFYYLYWYVGRDVSTPYNAVRVLLTNWDLVVHRFNQRWAYVICAAYVTEGLEPDGRSGPQTLKELKDFIRAAVPTFVKSEMSSSSHS